MPEWQCSVLYQLKKRRQNARRPGPGFPGRRRRLRGPGGRAGRSRGAAAGRPVAHLAPQYCRRQRGRGRGRAGRLRAVPLPAPVDVDGAVSPRPRGGRALAAGQNPGRHRAGVQADLDRRGADPPHRADGPPPRTGRTPHRCPGPDRRPGPPPVGARHVQPALSPHLGGSRRVSSTQPGKPCPIYTLHAVECRSAGILP